MICMNIKHIQKEDRVSNTIRKIKIFNKDIHSFVYLFFDILFIFFPLIDKLN